MYTIWEAGRKLLKVDEDDNDNANDDEVGDKLFDSRNLNEIKLLPNCYQHF